MLCVGSVWIFVLVFPNSLGVCVWVLFRDFRVRLYCCWMRLGSVFVLFCVCSCVLSFCMCCSVFVSMFVGSVLELSVSMCVVRWFPLLL